MQPQMPAPSYTPPPNQHDPYGFIMGQKQGKTGGPVFGQTDKKVRIIIVLVFVLVLAGIAMIFSALVFSQNNPTTENLRTLATQQTELVRVAEIGERKAQSTTVKNLAATTRVTATSDLNTTKAELKKRKVTMKAAELNAKLNKTTDTALTSAEQTNRFDDAFATEITKELTTYQSTLKTSYEQAVTPAEKKLFDGLYRSTSLLVPKKAATTP